MMLEDGRRRQAAACAQRYGLCVGHCVSCFYTLLAFEAMKTSEAMFKGSTYPAQLAALFDRIQAERYCSLNILFRLTVQ